ncbi:hypothetical protein [Halobacteriovorax sp. JY17]|uniref:hypothetical protein n=1 Tax=Halobacteriovorax sp. JY17 TaxID=2014617 RepID=UPI000C4DA12B|nr:hypothetical protein [Halobacteriovorax sp. JY17]PIK16223.1 MAG: hypothetical protein CES88_05670 [Halobacteriovorax sp. JY17]
MAKLIRLVAVFSILLLCVEAFSSEEVESDKSRGRVIQGHVIYGPTLTCELWNDSYRPIRVMNYTYDIYFRNRFGQVELAKRTFDCRYNCRVRSQTSQVFTGPLNNGPTISANCFAFVR